VLSVKSVVSAFIANTRKKPAWWNTRRHWTTSAYSFGSARPQPGWPSN